MWWLDSHGINIQKGSGENSKASHDPAPAASEWDWLHIPLVKLLSKTSSDLKGEKVNLHLTLEISIGTEATFKLA